ncbi:MAG: hypothetical protein RBG13Loki_1015, partial [Promethearchaeota archaeon CR_4]
DLSREIQQPRFEGKVLESLGIFYFVQKKFDDAESYFGLAVEVYRDQLGNQLKVLDLLQKQGNAQKHTNNVEKAIDIMLETRKLAHTNGSGATEGQILFQLGLLYERQGDSNSALSCYDDARRVYLSVYDTASANQMGQQIERLRSRLI